MSDTKEDLLLPPVTADTPRPASTRRRKICSWVTSAIFLSHSVGLWNVQQLFDLSVYYTFNNHADYSALCPQVASLTPVKNAAVWNDLVTGTMHTDEFKDRAIQWLSGAVQVKTESYDHMQPVGQDPRWDAFGPFHEYLLTSFPLVHTTLKLTKVNTWGLVYFWEGSDSSLKPALFAAHQDVVPVNPDTTHDWGYPPYSGHFDGERIWGRGSSDDKSNLIGVLSSVEALIESGFNPTRSVVLSFGFDEEASGVYGAAELAKYLKSTYGEDSFAFVVDEGAGFGEKFGTVYAMPGVAEKGYIDIRAEVASPGGHSSLPPPHTSIGMLAALLVHYEQNPRAPELKYGSISHDFVKCFAAYSPDLPKKLRVALIQSAYSKKALDRASKILFLDPAFSALVGTTQAIDLIGGGVKSNALPEDAWAVINHRIAVDGSVSDVISHDTQLLKPLAEKFNLSLVSYGEAITDLSTPTLGSLVLSDAFGTNLEPAPISPYSGPESAAYQLLSGTIKAVYAQNRDGDDSIIIQPSYMSGNTDTRYYWDLTRSIFRYAHNDVGPRGIANNIHTVNESMPVDSLVEMIQFYTTMILNADEAGDI